jgi:heterotetrameric sarcosine oxidase gamma subunit
VADLLIETPAGFGLATIMARRGADPQAIGARLGLTPPLRPSWTQAAHGLRLIGTGAGTWLAYEEHAPPFWAEELREQLRPVASVSDQSDGYAITRLSGERARTTLQRGAAIDFHPDAFAPGSAVTTVIAHIGVIIWQLDDAPTYEVATFRSFSDSFRHWLDQTAAAL